MQHLTMSNVLLALMVHTKVQAAFMTLNPERGCWTGGGVTPHCEAMNGLDSNTYRSLTAAECQTFATSQDASWQAIGSGQTTWETWGCKYARPTKNDLDPPTSWNYVDVGWRDPATYTGTGLGDCGGVNDGWALVCHVITPTAAPTPPPTPFHTSDFRMCIKTTNNGNDIIHQTADIAQNPFVHTYYHNAPDGSTYHGSYYARTAQPHGCESINSNFVSLTEPECKAERNAHFSSLTYYNSDVTSLSSYYGKGCVVSQQGSSMFHRVVWSGSAGTIASHQENAWYMCKDKPALVPTYQPDPALHELRTSLLYAAISEIIIRPLHDPAQACSTLGSEYADVNPTLCYDSSTKIFSLPTIATTMSGQIVVCPSPSIEIGHSYATNICKDAFHTVYNPPPSPWYALKSITSNPVHAANLGCTWDSAAHALLSSGITEAPTASPSAAPSTAPSTAPTYAPSIAPSTAPSTAPSAAPTTAPTFNNYKDLTVTVSNGKYLISDGGNATEKPVLHLQQGTTARFHLAYEFDDHPFGVRRPDQSEFNDEISYYEGSTQVSKTEFYAGALDGAVYLCVKDMSVAARQAVITSVSAAAGLSPSDCGYDDVSIDNQAFTDWGLIEDWCSDANSGEFRGADVTNLPGIWSSIIYKKSASPDCETGYYPFDPAMKVKHGSALDLKWFLPADSTDTNNVHTIDEWQNMIQAADYFGYPVDENGVTMGGPTLPNGLFAATYCKSGFMQGTLETGGFHSSFESALATMHNRNRNGDSNFPATVAERQCRGNAVNSVEMWSRSAYLTNPTPVFGGTVQKMLVFTPDITDPINPGMGYADYYCQRHSAMGNTIHLTTPMCNVADLTLPLGITATCTPALSAPWLSTDLMESGGVCTVSKAKHSGCPSVTCQVVDYVAQWSAWTDTCQPNPCSFVEPAFSLWPGALSVVSGTDCDASSIASNTVCKFEVAGHTCSSNYRCFAEDWSGGVNCVPNNCTYDHTLKPEQLYAGSPWHMVAGSNISTPDDVHSTCPNGIVLHGEDCLHSVAGHHSCTNRTCINGTMCHLTGDVADCSPSSVGSCSANECKLSDLSWGSAFFANGWMTMSSSTVDCQASSGTKAHNHECFAELSGASQAYQCNGISKVCKFGRWEWSNTTIDLQTHCQANPCVYDSVAMDAVGATSSCYDNQQLDHGEKCYLNRTGHVCTAPLICWAGTWKLDDYDGTRPVFDSADPDQTRKCTPQACPISALNVSNDQFGLSGEVANTAICSFEQTTEAGVDMGQAVPSGTTCNFETARSQCGETHCYQGQWNVSHVTCEQLKGCNSSSISNLPNDGTLATAIETSCQNKVVANGTVCDVHDTNAADGDHLCNSLQCYASQWHQVANPATGLFNLNDQCIDAPCIFNNTLTPLGAVAVCQHGESIQSGSECTYSRSGYNCSLTASVCKEGIWLTPAATACSELPCHYNASVHLNEQGDCDVGVVLAQTSCNYTKSGYNCASTTCIEGKFVPSKTQCTEAPCTFNASMLPSGVTSLCNDGQVLQHGHQCSVVNPGYDCGPDLHCDKSKWRIGMGGAELTSSSQITCNTPQCQLDSLTKYYGATTSCPANVYGPVTGPATLGANYQGSVCDFYLSGHTCNSVVCEEGSGGNWDTSVVHCAPNNCLFANLTSPDLGINLHGTSLAVAEAACKPTSGQTDLASGHSCTYTATGYDCDATQCINGSWTTPTPQCRPHNCTILSNKVPTGAVSSCPIGTGIVSGRTCSFFRNLYTCNSMTCYAGSFNDTATCTVNPTVAPTFAPSHAPTFASSVVAEVDVATTANNVTKFNISMPGFDINSDTLELTVDSTYRFKFSAALFEQYPFALKDMSQDPPTAYSDGLTYKINSEIVTFEMFYNTTLYPGDRTLLLSPKNSQVGMNDIVYYSPIHPQMPSIILAFAGTVAPTLSPTDSPTATPTDSPTETPTVSPTDNPTASPTDSPTETPTQAPTTPAPTLVAGMQANYKLQLSVNQTSAAQDLQDPDVKAALKQQLLDTFIGAVDSAWQLDLTIGAASVGVSRRLLQVGSTSTQYSIPFSVAISVPPGTTNLNSLAAMNASLSQISTSINTLSGAAFVANWSQIYTNNTGLVFPLSSLQLATVPVQQTGTSLVTVVAPPASMTYDDVIENDHFFLWAFAILFGVTACFIYVQCSKDDSSKYLPVPRKDV